MEREGPQAARGRPETRRAKAPLLDSRARPPEQSARLAPPKSKASPRAGAIPARRPELEVAPRRDGAVEVRDPRLLQIFTIDADDWAVAELFDGRADGAEVAARLAARRTLSVDDVYALAEDFERLHLLDTPAARAARPAQDSLAPPSLLGAEARWAGPLVSEPGARWDCHGCGACCHRLAVELTPAEDARIDRGLYDDILGDADYAEEQFLSAGEPARRVLRQQPERDHACIFLQADGLCAVHARQGMEAKPNACQTFPLLVVKVPYRPARLGLRTSCRSMARSYADGAALASHEAHAARVFGQIPIHRIPAKVPLFGEVLTFARFEALTDELQALLALDGVTPESLRTIDRRLLGGRVRRVAPRWALRVAKYVRDEAEGRIPTGEGAYRLALRRVRRAPEVLRAMAAREAAPSIPAACQEFLRAQLGHALWLGGPLNAPDAGYGLVALMVALTAALHAVGRRGTVADAEAAFDVFTAPLLETNEHLWPVLDAIDARFARRAREEMS